MKLFQIIQLQIVDSVEDDACSDFSVKTCIIGGVSLGDLCWNYF